VPQKCIPFNKFDEIIDWNNKSNLEGEAIAEEKEEESGKGEGGGGGGGGNSTLTLLVPGSEMTNITNMTLH